jgi:hypothetical protein
MVTGLAKGIGAFLWRKLQGSSGADTSTGGSEEKTENVETASNRSGISEVFYDSLEVLEQWQHINEHKRRFVQLEIGIVLNKDTRKGFISRLFSTLSSILSFVSGSPDQKRISGDDDPNEGVGVMREALRTLNSSDASHDDSESGEWSVTRSNLACQPGHLLDRYHRCGDIRSFPLTLTSSDLFIGKPHADSTNVLDQCDSLKETLALLHHLQTTFNSAGQNPRWKNYSITTDPSCFVHIHIGNKTEPPSLKTVKNVTKFLLANESIIDSSHAIHRIAHYNPSNQLIQASNKSLSSLFTSSTPSLNISGNPQDWLTFINRHKSITSLQYLFLSERDSNNFYTLNLHNLYCRADPAAFKMLWNSNHKKGTFEFRQSAGTLDPIDIQHRVTFYNAIIDLAERLTINEKDRLLLATRQRSMSDSNYKFTNLLEEIHVPQETIEYYQRILNHDFITERSLVPRHVGLAMAWLFSGSSAFMSYFVEESEEDRLAAMDPEEVSARIRDNARKGLYGARALLDGFPF